MRSAALVLAIVTTGALMGCPPDDKKAPASASPNKPCEKVGQSCEYSPGKLGTCIVKDGCEGAACFVCQSQH